MLASDTFWALVSLVIFLIIVFAAGAPKQITALLDRRSQRIRDELEDARKAREEAQALLSEYQRKRREAEADAEAIVEEARREAKRLTDEANEKLTEMVDRRTKAAENKIAQAEAHAISEVRSRATDLAVAAAADILSKQLSGNAGAQLVDSSIDTVRQRLN